MGDDDALWLIGLSGYAGIASGLFITHDLALADEAVTGVNFMPLQERNG